MFIFCADTKKELDSQVKVLVKEAASPHKKTSPKKTSPKKTAPKKTAPKKTTVKKAKDPETKGKSAKDKSGEKGSQKKKQKLAEIERVQKEAKWMFPPGESEVKSMLIKSPMKCCGVLGGS